MIKRELIKELSYEVRLSNELIQKGQYELTLIELKALLYMASKITPYDEEGTEYTFSAKKFCEVCGLNMDGGRQKQRVIEKLVELKSRVITIPLGGKRTLITSWFHDAIINEKGDEIKVSFSKYLAPYLYELRKNYTSFPVIHAVVMRSEYGIRLYKYLKSIKYKNYKPLIEIEELKMRLGCAGKYLQSSHFREKVIEPAMRDINTYTDLAVEWYFVKTGRKATHIQFIITLADDVARVLNEEKVLGLRD